MAVASLASRFFQSGDLSSCGQPESPACKSVKFGLDTFMRDAGAKFHGENHSTDLTMARIAVLSEAGSFPQAVTTLDKSCPAVTGSCGAVCEGEAVLAASLLDLWRVRAPPLPPVFSLGKRAFSSETRPLKQIETVSDHADRKMSVRGSVCLKAPGLYPTLVGWTSPSTASPGSRSPPRRDCDQTRILASLSHFNDDRR